MEKIHIYFVPGLAANSKIFKFLSLPKNIFELHFLDWQIPLNLEEPISNYAQRMCSFIEHKNPVLVGVSFGGIMVQEMSKHIITKKVIIISSIKSNQEIPKKLHLIQITKVYKLFPTKVIASIEKYEKYFLGDFFKKRAKIYTAFLSVRNPTYLRWAIYTILHWKQEKSLPKIVHIHGTKDGVFPVKNIKNYIKIEKGTHIMIFTKAKIITEIIKETLTC